MASYVMVIGPLVGWNSEEDEHTLAVTDVGVCAIGDGAMMMVVAAT